MLTRVHVLSLLTIMVMGISWANGAVQCYGCDDFEKGTDPKCAGNNATNYTQYSCPSGYCFYFAQTVYFNSPQINVTIGQRYEQRSCYDPNGEQADLPDDWLFLGINKTWDCMVTDLYVYSLHEKDMDQEFSCTCNTNWCNLKGNLTDIGEPSWPGTTSSEIATIPTTVSGGNTVISSIFMPILSMLLFFGHV